MALCAASAAQAQVTWKFDLPAQALAESLRTVARQTSTNILFEPSNVEDISAPPLSGQVTAEEAVRRLLAGTGLSAEWMPDHSLIVQKAGKGASQTPLKGSPASSSAADLLQPSKYAATAPDETIRLSQAGASAQGRADATNKGSRETTEEAADLIVTGSHIRGAKELAVPSITLDREQIEKSGYLTVPDLLRSLPQNFSQVSPEGYGGDGAARLSVLNYERITGVDLRGLGADSTLTLLNGQRRAGSIDGRVVDISVIPLSAIERVEVVTGGRSAVYGSDAIGGVVNFITRRSFSGTESRANYGVGQSGGSTMQFGQTGGAAFSRGGFIAAYDYQREKGVDQVDLGLVQSADVLGFRIVRGTSAPDASRHSVFASGHFDLTDGIGLYADSLFSRKRSHQHDLTNWPDSAADSFEDFRYLTDHVNVSAGMNVNLPARWTANVAGTYSRMRSDLAYGAHFDFGDGEPSDDTSKELNITAVKSASAVLDGPLPAFGGWQPRAAFGADVRGESREYTIRDVSTAVPLSRTVRSAFGEFLLERPAFQVSLAGRYDDYTDFGGTFNPQAGLVWEPVAGLALKASYSTSFRAPGVVDSVIRSPGGNLYRVSDPASPSGESVMWMLAGTNPGITPETATNWSFAIEYRPAFAHEMKLSLAYFDIDYRDRLDNPSFGPDQLLVLERADRFVGLIDRSPTPQRVADLLAHTTSRIRNNSGLPFNPATQNVLEVFPDLVIFDNRFNNIATEKVRGLDFGLDSRADWRSAELTFGLNATLTLDHERRVTSTSPWFPRFNEVGTPSDLKLRGNVGWARGAYSGTLFVNYVDNYRNPFTDPVSRMSSFTTADLTLRVVGSQLQSSQWLQGLSMTFGVQNLLDQSAPTVEAGTLLYDPSNADGLGRHFSLQLIKQW